MVLAGLLIQQRGCTLPLLNNYTGRGYFAFFAGLLLRQLIERYGVSGKLQLTAAGIIGFFGMLCLINAFFVSEGLNYLLTLFVYPSLIVLAVSPWCRKMLNFRWLGFLGEVSFGMYLFHYPVIQLVAYIDSAFALELPFSAPWVMLLITMLAILTSFVSLYLIEKPVTGFLMKYLKKD